MDTRTDNRGTAGSTGERSLVGLDIETTGLDPRKDDIVAVAIHDEHEGIVWPSGPIRPSLISNLYEQNVIIGHNLAFDLAFLREKYGVGYPDSSWDTMLAERLLTAGILEEEVNLKYLAQKYLGMEMDKSLTTTFTLEDEMTPEQIQYVLDDVKATFEIAKIQRGLLEKHKLGRVWALERKCLPIFTEMVRKGIMVDMDVLMPLLKEYGERHNVLEKELVEVMTPLVEWRKIEKRDEMQEELDAWNAEFEVAVLEFEDDWILGMPPNAVTWDDDQIGSFHLSDAADHPERRKGWDLKWMDVKLNKKDGKPEGMRRYTKAMLKEWRKTHPRPPAPKLDTKLINLNSPFQPKDAFKAMGVELANMRGVTLAAAIPDASDEAKQLLIQFAEWKKLDKLLNSFGQKIIDLRDEEGAIHGNFKQIGTDTGRPTCSEPNMLQMPSKKVDPRFRSIFVPRKGHLFVVADYSQIELRIMAQLSGDPAMVKAFSEGLDLHSYTASLMFNVPFEDVTALQRMTAKTINFGILYGMGPKKLRETLAESGVHISLEDAKDAVKKWKKSYKHAADKINQWQASVMTVGYTETPFGRKRFFNTETTDQQEIFGIQRAGANHVIQGTSADITKLAMVTINDMLDGEGTILLNIYDEIVVEVPEDLAFWAKEVVEIGMLEAAREVLKTVPVAVDAVVSRSWNEDDAISSTGDR